MSATTQTSNDTHTAAQTGPGPHPDLSAQQQPAGKAKAAPSGSVSDALDALDAELAKQTSNPTPGASLYGLLDLLARQFLGSAPAPAWPAATPPKPTPAEASAQLAKDHPAGEGDDKANQADHQAGNRQAADPKNADPKK